MLRYREGEPLVELVQHLAAAASNGDEAAAIGGAAPEGAANGGAAGTGEPTSSSSSFPLPPRVEVRVPADAASNQNRQVRARQLWGEKIKREREKFFRFFCFFSFGRRIERSIEPCPPKKTENRKKNFQGPTSTPTTPTSSPS